MEPGIESPDIVAHCRYADKRVREYAAQHQLPQYREGELWNTGPTPLVLMLDALIKDNRHLHRMIELILEREE